MLAGYHNFTIEQGADWVRVIQWIGADGNPVDLTNYTAQMKIKTLKHGGTTIATLTSAGGTLVMGASVGTITTNVTAVSTAAYSFVSAFYDLELTDTITGRIYRILEGRVFLSKEVTV